VIQKYGNSLSTVGRGFLEKLEGFVGLYKERVSREKGIREKRVKNLL
jgi:hypothetical protein